MRFTTCFTFGRRWVLLYSGVNFRIWKFYSLWSFLQDIVKVETSDDEPVVPVSIHNISVVDELWSCIIRIIDYHHLLELLMLHICIEKESLVRIGFLQLYFFFSPHLGNGSNFSILILSFLCTVQSLFCAVEYLCMGLCAPRQTVTSHFTAPFWWFTWTWLHGWDGEQVLNGLFYLESYLYCKLLLDALGRL